jgi:hypothetical protein
MIEHNIPLHAFALPYFLDNIVVLSPPHFSAPRTVAEGIKPVTPEYGLLVAGKCGHCFDGLINLGSVFSISIVGRRGFGAGCF